MGLLTPVAIQIGSISWMPKLLPQIVFVDKLIQGGTRGKLTILDVAGLPNLMLTVTGRKSGIPRSTPLLCVPYGSSMTVALGFRSSDFPKPLDGFGFLVPKRERRRLVACTWVGTKFSHRAPEGQVLLRCFLGGTDDAAVLNESNEAITEAVLEELQRIVGFSARPGFTRVFRWPCSMAQYAVGHQERMAEVKERLAANPGLDLAGNAYEGIGIPDCIRTGKQAAERILQSA